VNGRSWGAPSSHRGSGPAVGAVGPEPVLPHRSAAEGPPGICATSTSSSITGFGPSLDTGEPPWDPSAPVTLSRCIETPRPATPLEAEAEAEAAAEAEAEAEAATKTEGGTGLKPPQPPTSGNPE
jgi:hypothetical protein